MLVSIDYSNVEGIVSAVLADDDYFKDLYTKGVDIHQDLADKLGITRQQAKTINHAVTYGQGPTALANQLDIPIPKAAEFIDKFWELRHKTADLRDKTMKIPDDELETYYGHKYNDKQKKLQDTAKWNFLVQGTAADLMKLAIIDCYDYIEQHPEVKLLASRHDSLSFSVPDENAEQYAEDLKTIMCNVDPKFPLRAEISYGSM